MIADGWERRGRRWICPACVAYEEESQPCPDCGHEMRAHSGERDYGGYWCHDYNDGAYCTCTYGIDSRGR